MSEHYDAIVIGTGAGGGTLAYKLAQSGKNILILERGPFLPREKENWDTVEVMQLERYHAKETWLDKHGKTLRPGTGYYVGGNTKVYGAALLRLRERDFEAVAYHDGISPKWPLGYADFEPYYTEAERLYGVHGQHGLDPTEPWSKEAYPFPPVAHEPRIAEVSEALTARGYRPFPLPLGVRVRENDRSAGACIRCNTCDGFPCLVDAKNDSDTTCIRPILGLTNVTLLTEAKAVEILTDAAGRLATGVVVEHGGERLTFTSDLIAVAGGAINSAVLLLRSRGDAHRGGIGNGNDLVGRFFMKHNNAAVAGVSKIPNPTVFQKTLACHDFYWGDERFPYPMGSVQLLGKLNKDMLHGDAPAFTPERALDALAKHSVDWFLTTEDLPDAQNRVTFDGERVVLEYTENNQVAFRELLERWTHALKSIDCGDSLLPCSVYLNKTIPLQGVAHQVGTCRFGKDPATSVLDVNCKVHGVDNLYVVDGSFFPSSGAVNPSLTIIANALRVGDVLVERLGGAASERLAPTVTA